ncbi:hypothetical protein GCM10007086_28250 [Photobacterium aphoticum]|nr:hypothetical protein GCM10007086_28250 [Photobacterium aphoticum]
MEELIAQYTGADEDERLTRQYITQLEFDTTMHKLADYLSPGTRICEIGAATGRYSLTFSALGCEVTSVELAPDQVDILRKKRQHNNSHSISLKVTHAACLLFKMTHKMSLLFLVRYTT